MIHQFLVLRPLKNAILGTALGLGLSVAGFAAHAESDPIKVVTTIKPLGSLLMALGVEKPEVLIQGRQSPHGFALKPKQARSLQSADLIIWVGPSLEASLAKPIAALGQTAEQLQLMQTPGLNHLVLQDHGDHAHAHADDQAAHDDHGAHDDQAAHDDHGTHDDQAAHDDHGTHDDQAAHVADDLHEDHGHIDGPRDPHIWLNPANADAMQKAMAEELAHLDPENAALYRANSKALSQKLEVLMQEITVRLDAFKGLDYMVFHPAYGHFAEKFGLNPAVAVSLQPEIAPGAKRMRTVRTALEEGSSNCLFSEPQFSDRLVKTLSRGTNVKTEILDPLGANLTLDETLYFELVRTLADSFEACLG